MVERNLILTVVKYTENTHDLSLVSLEVRTMTRIFEKSTVMNVLTNHLSTLKRRYRVKSLAIFGSVARNECHAGSDLDVLVEFDGRADFDSYMNLKFFLEDLLGIRVDLVTRKAVRKEFETTIEEEAVFVA